MKTFSIARKTLRELWRERLSLSLTFLFPLMMLVFYYIAFGETDQGIAKHLRLLVLNQDLGATAAGGEHQRAGEQFISLMRALKHEGKPLFDVSVVSDRGVAEIALREQKAALLLTLPPNFTSSLLDPAPASPAVVSLTGDPNASNYVFAHSLLNELLREFSDYASGWHDATLSVAYEYVPGTGGMSDFEFGVPGMIVFGIMFVAVTTAEVLVRENVSGTLRRLRLTRVRARELLSGVTLAQMVVALAQIPVTFGAALALGFRGHGSLLLGMGVGLCLSLSAVGMGLLTACFARNDGEASNLSATIMVFVVLLSGAMFPMPETPIATIAGHTVQAHHLLPPAPASEALRKVFIQGRGLGEIGYELAATTLVSLVTLALGVALYQRLRLRRF
jgi:ABC-2 type transport system permease protein